MSISCACLQVFGQSKKIAASQKDEPGATLGMVKMFADAGVRMLHIGSNDFSTVPALPSVSAACERRLDCHTCSSFLRP